MKTQNDPKISSSSDWLDILFQHRNKAYGAYAMRKEYVKTLIRSQSITLLLLLLVFGGAYAGKGEKIISTKPKPESTIVVIETFKDKPEEEEVLQPQTQEAQPQAAFNQYTPPEIVDDINVDNTNDLRDASELTANIGRTNQIGEDSNNIMPPDGGGYEVIEGNELYSTVEVTKMAAFDGLGEFLNKNLEDTQADIYGLVKVGFTVEKDGSISNIQIVKSVSQELDDEAIRVVKIMPQWTPAEYNGAKVRLRFVLPIEFSSK